MDKELLEVLSKLLDEKLKPVLESQERIEKKLDSVVEQTADLTEFRTETRDNLDTISKDVKFIKHKLHETEEDVFDIKDHLKIIK